MTKQEISSIARDFIGENKFSHALEVLSAYVAGIDRALENELLIQKARFHRNSRDYRLNILPRNRYEESLARLIVGINGLIDILPNLGNEIKREEIKGEGSILADEQADEKKAILFLTANPKNLNSPPLQAEKQMREIRDELSRSPGRNRFQLIFEPAVKIKTITRAMLTHKPYIVHFSCHGASEGIYVEDDYGDFILFPTFGIDRLFKTTSNHVKGVLFNSINTNTHAELISQHGIYAIGMADQMGPTLQNSFDEAAKSFAIGFYQCLSNDDSLEDAFNYGMINISAHAEYSQLPNLWHNSNNIS